MKRQEASHAGRLLLLLDLAGEGAGRGFPVQGAAKERHAARGSYVRSAAAASRTRGRQHWFLTACASFAVLHAVGETTSNTPFTVAWHTWLRRLLFPKDMGPLWPLVWLTKHPLSLQPRHLPACAHTTGGAHRSSARRYEWNSPDSHSHCMGPVP